MEPIGTVTNFYPFLTVDTRKIIETVLNSADGYDDFIEKIVDRALNQDKTTDLALFATIQSWISGNHEFFKKLRPRLLEDDILKPWSYHEDFAKKESDGFPTAFKLAMSKTPAAWVQLHLHMMGAMYYNPPIDREISLDKSIELIEKQAELECFSPEIIISKGWRKGTEGNLDEALKIFRDAKNIAEQFDDPIRASQAQYALAGRLKEIDVFKALEVMEETFRTFKSLGAQHWASKAAGRLGIFHTIIGEYDLAIEFYREMERIQPQSLMGKIVIAGVLSRMYCDIDSPDEALEWIKYALDDEDITPQGLKSLVKLNNPVYLLGVARTMLLLGDLETGSTLLNEANKQTLQHGDEVPLIKYNYVAGLFEIIAGNLDAGFQSMADALAEAERLNYQVFVNSILLSLTKAEARNYGGGGSIESSGPWMTRLGIHAQERNYPGIRMQHALLKAEYQEKIGETEAAQLTLQDALTFTDSPGVKTMRKRILEKLEKLESSVDA